MLKSSVYLCNLKKKSTTPNQKENAKNKQPKKNSKCQLRKLNQRSILVFVQMQKSGKNNHPESWNVKEHPNSTDIHIEAQS